MYKMRAFVVMFLAVLVMAQTATAIPDVDIYKFRASYRGYAYFDEPEPQTFYVNTFREDSLYYYMVIRSNIGDVPPYDDFYIRFQCAGDVIWRELHTTDYDSWKTAGHISFKKIISSYENVSYDGSIVERGNSWCTISDIEALVPSGNTGYSRVFIELVPVLEQNVVTVGYFCADKSRQNLTSQLTDGIGSVLQNNVNIIYTAWIIFQVIIVLFVVIGVPVILFLLIRWVIWRVTGHKIFERSTSSYV